jgi:hypothetical protein
MRHILLDTCGVISLTPRHRTGPPEGDRRASPVPADPRCERPLGWRRRRQTDPPVQCWSSLQKVISVVPGRHESRRDPRRSSGDRSPGPVRARREGETDGSREKFDAHRRNQVQSTTWQNPYCERVIGSIRRECLGQVIVLNERHLHRILTDYFGYYHYSRPHLSLDRNSPTSRDVEPPSLGQVISIPMVGGLHHRYSRAA